MPRKPIDFDTVRRLARDLDGVEEFATRGVPSFRARGKLLAWIPVDKAAEPGSLAIRIDIERRAEFIAASPDIYYVTGHYLKYPTVLVRLSRIGPDELKDLLRTAWSFVMPTPRRERPHPGR